MDRIKLSAMRVWTYIGVEPEEKIRPQPVVIELEMKVNLQRAGETDCLADTVNYAAVYKAVKERVEGLRFNLLERLAAQAAAAVMTFTGVEAVTVAAAKQYAPLSGPVGSVKVVIRRERKDYAD